MPEATKHLNRVLSQIALTGAKVGVALNPATPVSAVECVLEYVDMVLIMSVNPGFGGQNFIPYTLAKVSQIKEMIDLCGKISILRWMEVSRRQILNISLRRVQMYLLREVLFLRHKGPK